jgi:hypothetical protein
MWSCRWIDTKECGEYLEGKIVKIKRKLRHCNAEFVMVKKSIKIVPQK